MDNEKDQTERHYVMAHKAWYAQANQITLPWFDLLVYTKSGSCLGGMSVGWIDLAGTTGARFQCFDDAWHLLPKFSDVFRKMAKTGEELTEAGFKQLLDRAGFVDRTEYIRPDIEKKPHREIKGAPPKRKARGQ